MQTSYKRLTDPQWEIIKNYLPIKRKRKYKLRNIVDAILWYLRTGSQWRNLPNDFPPFAIVFYYFRRWKKDGTLENLNIALNKKERRRVRKKPTASMLIIDSQSVKIAPFVCKASGVDGNKKVNGRKRHIITDSLGLIWGVVVHSANEPDGSNAERVVSQIESHLNRAEKILADKAYRHQFVAWMKQNHSRIRVSISRRKKKQKGFVLESWRWLVERAFGMLSFYRRLSKDYEKTPESAEAWVLWHNCQIILNRLV